MSTSATTREIAIDVGGRSGEVEGLLQIPPRASHLLVFAHGAGAGMRHAFMESAAAALGAQGIATLRYQFPYVEQGGKRPDAPKLAQATVRAAVAEAAKLMPKLALIAGGKSFGGRMTSQAQAEAPLAGVRGLAFLGFPLHAAGRPSEERAAHLFEVKIPMLFLQGTRDALADVALMRKLAKALGKRATLIAIADGDHSFHVPARTGRKDADVRGELLDALAGWIEDLVG